MEFVKNFYFLCGVRNVIGITKMINLYTNIHIYIYIYYVVGITVDISGIRMLKVGLSFSKKIIFICFNETLLKMMKNVFYFILKVLSVLKIFKFLS